MAKTLIGNNFLIKVTNDCFERAGGLYYGGIKDGGSLIRHKNYFFFFFSNLFYQVLLLTHGSIYLLELKQNKIGIRYVRDPIE